MTMHSMHSTGRPVEAGALELGLDCLELMERLAGVAGREVSLICDPSHLVPHSDRWIAHVGARIFGKGATAREALRDLLRQSDILASAPALD